MGIKWTELSQKQRLMMEWPREHYTLEQWLHLNGYPGSRQVPEMPPERARIDSEAVLGESKVKTRVRAEKREQGDFANWLLLQNLPFVWHATHARSKATPGTPDFWVGVRGRGMWLEFKSPLGELSLEQTAFRDKVWAQGLEFVVVYSAAEAIELVRVARGS